MGTTEEENGGGPGLDWSALTRSGHFSAPTSLGDPNAFNTPVIAGNPAGEELRSSARRAAGQVPELAKLLGLPIPPPPGPRRPSTSGARGS